MKTQFIALTVCLAMFGVSCTSSTTRRSPLVHAGPRSTGTTAISAPPRELTPEEAIEKELARERRSEFLANAGMAILAVGAIALIGWGSHELEKDRRKHCLKQAKRHRYDPCYCY